MQESAIVSRHRRIAISKELAAMRDIGSMIEKLNRVAGYYRDRIEVAGYTLRHSTDFEALEAATRKNGDMLTPHFSTAENTFVRREAFWVGVWEGDICIATLACKFQALGCETLAQYSRRYWQRSYARGSTEQIVFSAQQKRYMESLKGNLVYCGEYRVSPDYQKSGIGGLLAGYTKPAIFLLWPETDFIYIYMEDKDVRRGLLPAIGLSTQIQNALNWDTAPSQAKADYWLAGIAALEFEDWLDDELRVDG